MWCIECVWELKKINEKRTPHILYLDDYKDNAINRNKELEILVYLNYKNWIVEYKQEKNLMRKIITNDMLYVE